MALSLAQSKNTHSDSEYEQQQPDADANVHRNCSDINGVSKDAVITLRRVILIEVREEVGFFITHLRVLWFRGRRGEGWFLSDMATVSCPSRLTAVTTQGKTNER